MPTTRKAVELNKLLKQYPITKDADYRPDKVSSNLLDVVIELLNQADYWFDQHKYLKSYDYYMTGIRVFELYYKVLSDYEKLTRGRNGRRRTNKNRTKAKRLNR